MTIDEAIGWLEIIGESVFENQASNAIDMAIEALEQLEAINAIIDVSNLKIQEDVVKYKMIVAIMKDER